jgi:phosphatidylserine/phosphatidylglycerophosphate/cardiolipin synthase-like enzyme
LGGCVGQQQSHWVLGNWSEALNLYVQAATDHRWVIDRVEQYLTVADAAVDDDLSGSLRKMPTDSNRPLGVEHLLVAISALEDLGFVERFGTLFRLRRANFLESEQLRLGIKAAVNVMKRQSRSEKSHLCVSTPPSIPDAAEYLIRETCSDLRSDLLDLISSATETIIIASPFWDAATSAELVTLLQKRANVDVELTVLGRFSEDLKESVKTELRRISINPRCEILSWFETAGAGTETFHFKAISVDRGKSGYLGSANMTTSSLRSRMELGLILRDDLATQLDRVLRIAMTLAKPVNI